MKKINILKLGVFSSLSYLSYMYLIKASPLNIQYEHYKLKEIIKLNPSLSQKKYYPSFFFSSGEVQTIMLLLMNKIETTFKIFTSGNFSKTRKIIPAKDGEYIYVDFFSKTSTIDSNKDHFENFEFLSKFNNSEIIVFIPGACGRSGEFYIKDVMERFLAENFKCISVNHRGILKYPLQKSNLYHSGYTDDLKDVFEFLKEKLKDSNFYLVGFSMGGNITTKFVGELSDMASYYNIKGGVSVCGPLDLKKFTEMTEIASTTKIYSKFFLKNLMSVFNRNSEYLLKNMFFDEKKIMLNELNKSHLASDFYRIYIFKSFGFSSENEYYELNSGKNFIKNIKIPFLCIFSEDDPLIPLDSIQDSGWEKNENFILATTKSGGHVGFFKGLYLHRWICEPILEFIRDVSTLH